MPFRHQQGSIESRKRSEWEEKNEIKDASKNGETNEQRRKGNRSMHIYFVTFRFVNAFALQWIKKKRCDGVSARALFVKTNARLFFSSDITFPFSFRQFFSFQSIHRQLINNVVIIISIMYDVWLWLDFDVFVARRTDVPHDAYTQTLTQTNAACTHAANVFWPDRFEFKLSIYLLNKVLNFFVKKLLHPFHFSFFQYTNAHTHLNIVI